MKKEKLIMIFIIITIIMIGIFLFFKLINKDKSDNIPDDYIAVFHGENKEVTYSTYIYKIDNKQANYGFKYINTKSTTKGSNKIIIKITKKGQFDWTDGAFSVAKKNNAYSYVSIPNSDKIYTIEEFQNMFLMN